MTTPIQQLRDQLAQLQQDRIRQEKWVVYVRIEAEVALLEAARALRAARCKIAYR